jgi:hypothetical protein
MLAMDSEIAFYDEYDGSIQTIEINFDTFFVLSVFCFMLITLMIGLGFHGIKTFKPILKDIEHDRLNVIANNSDRELRSKQVKHYKKGFVKTMIAVVFILLIGTFIARDFLMTTTDDIIDVEYDKYEQNKNHTKYFNE